MKARNPPVTAQGSRQGLSFSRGELECILIGLTRSWGREGRFLPGATEVFFQDLSMEELEALACFFLN